MTTCHPPTPKISSRRRCSRPSGSLVGQDRMIERLFVCWLARGHCLLEGAPGPGQDAGRRDGRPHPRRLVRPPPVHPRPRARRPRRHPHLPAVAGGVRRRARPGLRQRRARRRDQPGAGQGAVGAARGDGRAARVDRRRHLRRADAVPRARHPEPDRERGRVPAARGPARPLPHEGARRLPDRPRGGRDRAAHERRTRPRAEQVLDPAALLELCRPRPTRCSSTTRCSTTPSGSSLATRSPREHGLDDLAPLIAHGASPRATLGLVAAGRALALLRGRPLRAAPGRLRRRPRRAPPPGAALLRGAGRRRRRRAGRRARRADRPRAAGHARARTADVGVVGGRGRRHPR